MIQVRRNQSSVSDAWYRYGRAILPANPPHEWAQPEILALSHVMDESGAAIARWTQGWDLPTPTEFWFVIKDKPLPLAAMSKSKRYKVNRAARELTISLETDSVSDEELYSVFVSAHQRYGVRPSAFSQFAQSRHAVLENASKEIWVARTQAGQAAAYQYVQRFDDVAFYSATKFDPAFLHLHVSMLLFHSLDEHYLVSEAMKYVLDGARNLIHETRIQDFLIANLGWRRAYTDLHIAYASKFAPILRGTIGTVGALRLDSNNRFGRAVERVLPLPLALTRQHRWAKQRYFLDQIHVATFDTPQN